MSGTPAYHGGMKTLLLLISLILAPQLWATNSHGGVGECVAAMIDMGSSPGFAVQSACRRVESLGHGICAGALIRAGRTEGVAVLSECRLVKNLDQATCAKAMIERGDSAFSAVLGPCSKL